MNPKFKNLAKDITDEFESEINHSYVGGQNSILNYLMDRIAGKPQDKIRFKDDQVNKKLEKIIEVIDSKKS